MNYLTVALNILDTAFIIQKNQFSYIPPYFFSWKGNILLSLHRYKEAEMYFQIAIQKCKDEGILIGEKYIFLIKLYLLRKSYTKALKVINILCKIDKDIDKDTFSQKYNRSFLGKNPRFYSYLSITFYFTKKFKAFKKNHYKLVKIYLQSKNVAWNRNHFSVTINEQKYNFQYISFFEKSDLKKIYLDYQSIYVGKLDRVEEIIYFLAYLFVLKLLGKYKIIFDNKRIEKGSFIYYLLSYKKIEKFEILDIIMDIGKEKFEFGTQDIGELLKNTPLYNIVYDR